MRTSVNNLARKIGLPTHFRQHDLRHRRVTTWLADGQAPQLVRQAMGHSDLRTTMAYYSETPEPLLQLVAPKISKTSNERGR
jgi:integrase